MEQCQDCWKDLDLCVCKTITPQDNRVSVLMLQHPQEPDKELGSARIGNLILRNSALRVGLSSANLKTAIEHRTERPAAYEGERASPSLSAVDPAEWIVLFLGAKYKFTKVRQGEKRSDIYFFDKNDQAVERPLAGIKGIVAIDGTWAQAKTMWWRNPWLLKLTRAVIDPRQTSMYGKLRKEPRRESLSTIEAVAYTLEALGEDSAVSAELLSAFRRLLQQFRDREKMQNPTGT